MSELSHQSNDIQNTRPFGRFLLVQNKLYQPDLSSYERSQLFYKSNEQFIHTDEIFVTSAVVTDDGRFEKPNYMAAEPNGLPPYDRTLSVAVKIADDLDRFDWRLRMGSDQVDMSLRANDEDVFIRRQFDNQGRVLTQKTLRDKQHQQVAESVLWRVLESDAFDASLQDFEKSRLRHETIRSKFLLKKERSSLTGKEEKEFAVNEKLLNSIGYRAIHLSQHYTMPLVATPTIEYVRLLQDSNIDADVVIALSQNVEWDETQKMIGGKVKAGAILAWLERELGYNKTESSALLHLMKHDGI